MFGFLKKKLDDFSEKLKHKVIQETPKLEDTTANSISSTKEEKQITQEPKLSQPPHFEEDIIQEQNEPLKEMIKKSKEELSQESIETNFKKEEFDEQSEIDEEETIENFDDKYNEPKDEEILNDSTIEIKDEEEFEDSKTISNIENEIREEEFKVAIKNKYDVKKVNEDKRELKAKIGATGKIKGFFSGHVEIDENKISELLFELELSLLESDVEQDTAQEIIKKIKERLVGQKLSIKNLDGFLKEQIKEILTEMMTTPKRNILEEIKNGEKPYIIMMLGPNGAGKTTHIAKLTHYFKKQGLTCVWAAADTFRSGAIHQLQEHADKLDIKVIKQEYGADPAAVAFDALTSAKANKFDVILIDTAGRQETNKNLMEELKKIERVVKPNLKIYVGESYTGQGLLTMAQEFDKAIGIDGFILSKIDADAKGGTTISLLYQLKKPIFYVGTGQGYEDLQEFTPEFILNRII
ncbi:MAG: signal recognition particle-docking protein FtsY [archaeon]|jgi:fused signal recognition particle receptor